MDPLAGGFGITQAETECWFSEPSGALVPKLYRYCRFVRDKLYPLENGVFVVLVTRSTGVSVAPLVEESAYVTPGTTYSVAARA